jgi:hypothetical protein
MAGAACVDQRGQLGPFRGAAATMSGGIAEAALEQVEHGVGGVVPQLPVRARAAPAPPIASRR